MKFSPLTTTYSLLTAAGLAALARWLHPATFSPHILTALLVVAVAVAIVYLWNHA